MNEQQKSSSNDNSFKVSVHNINRHVGVKQFRNFLSSRSISFRKLKLVGDHAYLFFDTSEQKQTAMGALNRAQLKGQSLEVRSCSTDLSASTAGGEQPYGKRLKMDSNNLNITSVEEVVTPLASIPYSEQLNRKFCESENILRQLMKAISSTYHMSNLLNQSEVVKMLTAVRPSPSTIGYRNKCEFNVGVDHDGKPTVGFRVNTFKDSLTNLVMSPVNCIHIPQPMKNCVSRFQRFIDSTVDELPIFDCATKMGFWRQLTVRCFCFDVMVIVAVNPLPSTTLEYDLLEIDIRKRLIDTFMSESDDQLRVTSLFLQPMAMASDAPVFINLAGCPFVYENLFATMRFRISPGAFFQTNSRGSEVLHRVIGELGQFSGRELLLDICCGTGTIGLTLAKQVLRVIGIEMCEEAVRDARINMQNNEITNAEFVCGKVENVFGEVFKRIGVQDSEPEQLQPGTVVGVLDPPRAGLADRVICAIRTLGCMRRLVYVSCDPKAAQKNFVDLCRPTSNKYGGVPFQLKKVVPVDLFPHTTHCEWAVLLER